jgi:histidinol-phosphatase
VWDVAAPAVLVEEAGGRYSDAFGERSIHAATAVATNGLLHEVALRRLARADG